MSEWKIEENKYGIEKPCFALRYGDFKGLIHIDTEPGMFGSYGIRWYVFRPTGSQYEGPLFEGYCELSQRQLMNADLTGRRITETTLLKLLRPAVDNVQFALFCCVVEKLICG